MKSKRITFTPGGIIPNDQPFGGHQKLPALTLPDGSQILLHGFDPVASQGRRYKRRAMRLPTLDTRNEMGALFAAAPELLAAAKDLLDQATGPAQVYGDGIGNNGKKTGLSGQEFNARTDERIARARAAIAKAKLTP